MGDGDDTFTLMAGGEVSCYGILDMGAGNDTFTIGSGADFSPSCQIDFGTGYDTLELNGTLTIWGEYYLQSIENVVGNGTLIINGYAGDEFISKFENAGITVITSGYEPDPEPTPDPTPEPEPTATQYFGTAKFSEDWYGDYSDQWLDEALKTAVVSPLQTSDGADTAVSHAGTFSYFANGLDFGGGNDTLIVSESMYDVAAEGCWFNGDLNFGSGNNGVETCAQNGGIYADNLYFGCGVAILTVYLFYKRKVALKFIRADCRKKCFKRKGRHRNAYLSPIGKNVLITHHSEKRAEIHLA